MSLRSLACLCAALAVAALPGCEPPQRGSALAQAEGQAPARRTPAPAPPLDAEEAASVRLFEESSPSVVQIVAIDATPARGGRQPELAIGSGSGFVWDEQGHIVTNHHVVGTARLVAVRFPDGSVAKAEVVGRAPQYEIALLRAPSMEITPRPLPIGRSRDLRVGQKVFAIGNPYGLEQSLSTGIVSALDRRLPSEVGREITGVIQTDAAINPGNSGGPLLDSGGRVIGVNTAIYSPSGAFAGIGFAVPIDVVARIAPELIRTGRAAMPGIGVSVADELTTARLGVNGLIVVAVTPGGPSARAGLRPADPRTGRLGDVITGVNGRSVRTLRDLVERFEEVGVGGRVELTVRRDGQERRVAVQVVDVGPR